jgi:hypothetical protein
MATALVMASGVAWAATVRCTAGADGCIGTNEDDQIYGTSGLELLTGEAQEQEDDITLVTLQRWGTT